MQNVEEIQVPTQNVFLSKLLPVIRLCLKHLTQQCHLSCLVEINFNICIIILSHYYCLFVLLSLPRLEVHLHGTYPPVNSVICLG